MSVTQSVAGATGKALLACAGAEPNICAKTAALAQQAKQTKVVVRSVEIVAGEDNDLNQSSGL
jgi:hypothetical protein